MGIIRQKNFAILYDTGIFEELVGVTLWVR